MCFLKTNLAKAIGHRLRGVPGHLFAGRYHASMVSDEEAAQIRILRYILSHGVKENLVDTVREWPGVHCASALIDGTTMTGVWRAPSSDEGSLADDPGTTSAKDGAAHSQSGPQPEQRRGSDFFAVALLATPAGRSMAPVGG